MEIIAILPLLAFFISIPFFTAIFATRMGRKFWPWLAVGCILPFISVFILFFLPAKSKNGQA
jgi:hypothetical protein